MYFTVIVAAFACHKTSTLLVNVENVFHRASHSFCLILFPDGRRLLSKSETGCELSSYYGYTCAHLAVRSCAQPRPPHSFLLRAKPYSARGLNPACCRGVPSCTRLRRGMWIARPERSSWLENSKRSPVVGPEVSAEGWQCASQRAGVRATSWMDDPNPHGLARFAGLPWAG